MTANARTESSPGLVFIVLDATLGRPVAIHQGFSSEAIEGGESYFVKTDRHGTSIVSKHGLGVPSVSVAGDEISGEMWCLAEKVEEGVAELAAAVRTALNRRIRDVEDTIDSLPGPIPAHPSPTR